MSDGGTDMDQLGEALRAAIAATDPVPVLAAQAARHALAWRDPDAALAALVSDSLVEPVGLTARGTPPRLLTFDTGALTIDLEVTVDGGQARLLGQLSPGRAATVTVVWAAGSTSVESDERGRFAVDGLPVDWLRVSVGGEEPARTEWFRA